MAKLEAFTDSATTSTEENYWQDDKARHIEEFKSNTTLHGVSFVFNSRSKGRKAFWVIIMLAFTAGLLSQIVDNCLKMFAFEIVVSTTTTSNTEVKFPAVTVCNENIVKRSKVKNTTVEQQIAYITRSTRNVSEDVLNSTCDIRNLFKENGHNITEMLLSGVWNVREQITGKDFEPFSHFEYGQCYTFNGGTGNTSARSIEFTGPLSGLGLLLDVQPEEYHDLTPLPDSVGVGFRVVIHDQKQAPLVGAKGISVPPGYRNEFAIKMKKMKRMESPYPSKCKTDDVKLPLSDKPYSVSTCEAECALKTSIEICGCKVTDEYDDQEVSKGLVNIPLCRVRDYNCVTRSRFSKESICDCPLPCDENDYEIRVSKSYHPSPQFARTAQRLYYKNQNFSSQQEFKDFFRQRAVYIRVFFETLQSDDIQENAAYDLRAFLADSGGHLGLFLGCSLVTVCEVMDLLLFLFMAAFCKKYSSGTKISAKPNSAKM